MSSDMWAKFISTRISLPCYPWLMSVNCTGTVSTSLLRAGANGQAAVYPRARLLYNNCCFGLVLVKSIESNKAIYNNIRSYSTRRNRYTLHSKSFLQRIPREVLVLVMVGITGGVVYGWSKNSKFDAEMDEINNIIKSAQDLDIHENQKEKAIKLYDDVLKKVKTQINSEQSLHRMSALTTKYVFVIDQLANLMHNLGKLKEAEDYYKQSLQALLSHGASKDDDAVIEISLKLASIYAEENSCFVMTGLYWFVKNVQQPIRLQKSCVKTDQEPSHIINFQSFPSRSDLVYLTTKQEWNNYRHELAENGFSWCVENARKKVNENEKLNVNSSALLGICLESFGKYLLSRKYSERAISLLSEALVISRNIFGEKHEQAVLLLNNLGVAYFEAGDMEHSKMYFKEAIHFSTKEKHRDLWSFHLNLANVLAQTGYTEEAKQDYHQAMKLCHSESVRNNIKDQLSKITS